MKNAPNPIHNPPDKKASKVGHLVWMQSMGQPVWTPRQYENFAKEGYTENAIVFRCIRLIVDACMSIPFEVYDEKGKPIEDHPFYDLIAHPNPFEGESDVIDALLSYLLIAGNTYLEAVMIGREIRELFVLRPDRMKVALDPKGRPAYYEYTVGGSSPVKFPVKRGGQLEICHIKNFHPTHDTYGLSAIEPAAFSIDVHSAAGKYNKALLDNSAKPSGALVVVPDKEGDASITEEQFERLKSELESRYQGSENAGRPMVLEGGLDWKQMGMSPQDMEFVQGKNQAAREVALAFGVPPQLLGIPGDNTYSNYKEANVAFYRQTVLPLMTKVCRSLSNFFSPTYGENFRLWFDIDQIAGLTQEREDTWTRINTANFLTVNEKREAVGYDEVEGGDDVLIQSSLVPLNIEEEEEELPVDPITGEPLEEDLEEDPDEMNEEDDDNPPPEDDDEEDEEDKSALSSRARRRQLRR